MVGAGAVALAHAREAPTAPLAIEAQHGAGCVVVHNALQCATCQGAHLAMPAPHRDSIAASAAHRAVTPADRTAPRAGPDLLDSAPPRAPPALRA